MIISGLPRSGTAMMMQMLEAGGMRVVTDRMRKPDEKNPIGYYEYEKVKRLGEDASWLDACKGKALKVISALLYHLPGDRHYKVIFMERKLGEILASQEAMLESLGRKMAVQDDQKMADEFQEHLHRIKDWLARQRNMETIYVNYGETIRKPVETAKRVVEFIGERLEVDKMASAVRESLYRQRKP